MWKKIDHFVEECHMISDGDRILLGLSGGADSVLLARYLLSLRERGKIVLHVLHVNHQLRPEEADRDEAFVQEFCRKWKIPYKICHEDVSSYAAERKISLEEAGREIRYLRMEEYAKGNACEKIALAHHENDQAETILFRMIRGTGPSGFSGILPVYQNRIRPLLCVDKAEILGILEKIGQEYVEDSTNAQMDYTRNYIRHCILPKMEEVNLQVVSHIARLAEQMREQNTYVKREIGKIYDTIVCRKVNGVEIALESLEKLDSYVQKELIRSMILEACQQQKDITSVHVNMVLDLMKHLPGKWNTLPYDKIALRKESSIYIGNRPKKEVEAREKVSWQITKAELNTRDRFSICLEEQHQFTFEIMPYKGWTIEKNDCSVCLDYDKIKNGISIRRREQGDYFILDSAGKRKTLRRYFIDEKIPSAVRDQIYLLAEEDHILWITGGRISEDFKVTDSTRFILKVEYSNISK